MSRSDPAVDCLDLTFRPALAMSDAAEVALEDYARELSRARKAEATRDPTEPGKVQSLHLCGVAEPLNAATRSDVEAFARALVAPETGGLGWS